LTSQFWPDSGTSDRDPPILSALGAGSAEFLVPLLEQRPNHSFALPVPSDWRTVDDSWRSGYRRGYFLLPVLANADPLHSNGGGFPVGPGDWRPQFVAWVRANTACGRLSEQAVRGLVRDVQAYEAQANPSGGRYPMVDTFARMLEFCYSRLCGGWRPDFRLVEGRIPLGPQEPERVGALLAALSRLSHCRLRNRGRVHVLSPDGYYAVAKVVRHAESRYGLQLSPDIGHRPLEVDLANLAATRGWTMVLSGSVRVLELSTYGVLAHAPWHSHFSTVPLASPADGISVPCRTSLTPFWPRGVASRGELNRGWQPGAYVWHYGMPALSRHLSLALGGADQELSEWDLQWLDLVAQVAYGRRRTNHGAALRRAVGAFRELAAAACRRDLLNSHPRPTPPRLAGLAESCMTYSRSRSARRNTRSDSDNAGVGEDFVASGARMLIDLWRIIGAHGQATIWHLTLFAGDDVRKVAPVACPRFGYLCYRCDRKGNHV
jgi:hypothetical protein